MSTVERKYALSKVASGDYVFPSNDGQTIWRIAKYTDGPSSGLDEWPRDREMWGVWRWAERIGAGGHIDVSDRARWEFYDWMHETRAGAIKAALAA